MLISVIVPVYNASLFLEGCISSILSQTYSNFELILIDDKSTDNSFDICKKRSKMDSRIKVFQNPQKGVSSARNFGINKSNGELVAFIDSDDFVDKDYLEALYKNMIENNSDISFCLYNKIDDCKVININETNLKNVNDTKLINFDNFLISFLFPLIGRKKYVMGCVWRILFKKELIKTFFCDDIVMQEDLLFVLSNIFNCRKISVVNSYLYNYRVQNGISQKYISDYLINQIKFMSNLSKNVLEKIDFSKSKYTYKYVYSTLSAYLAYCCFANEFKIRNQNRDIFIKNINNIKKSKLYPFFRFKMIFKFKEFQFSLKYLIMFLIIKLHVYAVL